MNTSYKNDFDLAVELMNRKKEIQRELKSGPSIPALIYTHLVTSKLELTLQLQTLYRKYRVE